jgi:hypothetical protein
MDRRHNSWSNFLKHMKQILEALTHMNIYVLKNYSEGEKYFKKGGGKNRRENTDKE